MTTERTILRVALSDFAGLDFAAVGFVLLLLYLLYKKAHVGKEMTPPGPPGLPLIGNILDMPQKEAWKVYLEWGQKYSMLLSHLYLIPEEVNSILDSDILSMKVPGAHFFILNSYEAIQDLLVKRATIYSDR